MIRIYFNLHKKLFSIQKKIGGKWKVVNHGSFIRIQNAKFVVSQKGRARVLKNKRKNVHAYIEGKECDDEIENGWLFSQIAYNPYYMEQFREENGEDVTEADMVVGFVVEGRPIVVGFWWK